MAKDPPLANPMSNLRKSTRLSAVRAECGCWGAELGPLPYSKKRKNHPQRAQNKKERMRNFGFSVRLWIESPYNERCTITHPVVRFSSSLGCGGTTRLHVKLPWDVSFSREPEGCMAWLQKK